MLRDDILLLEVINMATESKPRLNLALTPEIEKYISESAKAIGIARSAFVLLCVNQYRQNERNFDMMSMVPAIERLAALENKKKEGTTDVQD